MQASQQVTLGVLHSENNKVAMTAGSVRFAEMEGRCRVIYVSDVLLKTVNLVWIGFATDESCFDTRHC